jgi:hypothetical protein
VPTDRSSPKEKEIANMSVDKKCRISKEPSKYSIIPNKVSQHLIYNPCALGLYVYMFSLPPGWEFHKSHLQKMTGLGRDKLDKTLKVLEGHNLLNMVQIRGSNGQFELLDFQVKDGNEYKINKLEKCVQPFTDLPLTANQSLVNSTYKENKNKINKENKINTSCSSKSDEPNKFELFWKKYPRKQKKKRVNQIWIKKDLDKIADKIIKSLENRLNSDWKGKDLQFIPLPDSYLNQERWEDEIDPIAHEPGKIGKPIEPKKNELRSTVMEYGPGHPLWEANREWELKNEKGFSSRTSSNGDTRGNGVRKASDYIPH